MIPSDVKLIKTAMLPNEEQILPTSFVDPITAMEFVYVPAGSFLMGDTFEEGEMVERPCHEVYVSQFYMGKYVVTVGEYRKIFGDYQQDTLKNDRLPVEKMSWHDTQMFIEQLNAKSQMNYRLPTEAEWEYAARDGGKKVRFGNGKDTISPYGASFNASEHYKEHYSKAGLYRKEMVEVGTFAANNLGLYDMSGNVLEWCDDWYDPGYYQVSPKSNPLGPPSGTARVVRGGCWGNPPKNLRATFRKGYPPDRSYATLSFRLVLPV